MSKNSAQSILHGPIIEQRVGKIVVPTEDKVLCGCSPQYVCVADQYTGLLAAVNPARDVMAALLCSEPTVTKGKESTGTGATASFYDIQLQDYNTKTETGRRANQLQQKCKPGSPCPDFPQDGFSPSYPHLKEIPRVHPQCEDVATRLGQEYMDTMLQLLGPTEFEKQLSTIVSSMNEYVSSSSEYRDCATRALCKLIPEQLIVSCPDCESMLSCFEPGTPEYAAVLRSESYLACTSNCASVAMEYPGCEPCAHLATAITNPTLLSEYLQCVVDNCMFEGPVLTSEQVCPSCTEYWDPTTGTTKRGYQDCAQVACKPDLVDIEDCPSCLDHVIGLVRMIPDPVYFIAPGQPLHELWLRSQEPESVRRNALVNHLPEWRSDNTDRICHVTYSEYTTALSLLDPDPATALVYWNMAFEFTRFYKAPGRVILVSEGLSRLSRNSYENCYLIHCADPGDLSPLEQITSPITWTVSGNQGQIGDFTFCLECIGQVDLISLNYGSRYEDCARISCFNPLEESCEPECAHFITPEGQYLPGYYDCVKKKACSCDCEACDYLLNEFGVDSQEWRACYIQHCLAPPCSCEEVAAIHGVTSLEFVTCLLSTGVVSSLCQEVWAETNDPVQTLHCYVTSLFDGKELSMACCRYSRETQLEEYLACIKEHCSKTIDEPLCDVLGIPQTVLDWFVEVTTENLNAQTSVINLNKICLTDPKAVIRLQADPTVKIKHAGRLALVDDQPYLEDVFYFPETEKTVTKRTKVQSDQEIRSYLGDALNGVSEEVENLLIREAHKNLKDITWLLDQPEKPQIQTSAYRVETYCEELTRSMDCQALNLCEEGTGTFDPQSNVLRRQFLTTRTKMQLGTDCYECEIVDIVTQEVTKIQVCPPITSTWEVPNLPEVADIPQEVIEDIISNDPCIQNTLDELKINWDSQEARDLVRFQVIASSRQLINIVKDLVKYRITFTQTCLESLTGYETVEDLPGVRESIQNLKAQKGQEIAIPNVSYPNDVVPVQKIRPVNKQPICDITIMPGPGVEIILPTCIIEHIEREDVTEKLKMIEEHLIFVNKVAYLQSTEYIEGLKAIVFIPSRELPKVDTESFTPDSIKPVVETLIKDTSPLLDSLLYNKGLEVEVKIIDVELEPLEQARISVGPKFNTDLFKQPPLVTETQQSTTMTDEEAEAIRKSLEALNNRPVVEIPVDVFSWADEQGKVTISITEKNNNG